jgi:hypothetical protein
VDFTPHTLDDEARLLAAVGEKANEGSSLPVLGILVPMQWAYAFAAVGRS